MNLITIERNQINYAGEGDQLADHIFYNIVRRCASNGKFFTARFVKKDGTIRTITGRTGVKKNLKEGAAKRKYNPAAFNNIPVFEVGAGNNRVFDTVNGQYRTICTDRLLSFKQGKIKIRRIITAGFLLDLG
jgi:hypothetical protein